MCKVVSLGEKLAGRYKSDIIVKVFASGNTLAITNPVDNGLDPTLSQAH